VPAAEIVSIDVTGVVEPPPPLPDPTLLPHPFAAHNPTTATIAIVIIHPRRLRNNASGARIMPTAKAIRRGCPLSTAATVLGV
jgi:hypothetical protein